MSTILDALRKVEEDSRTRNADVRTRLLTGPTRFNLRSPRRQRLPWVIGMGLSLLGVAVGVGLAVWSWPTRPASEVSAVAKNTAPPQTFTPPPSPAAITNSAPTEVVTAAAQTVAQPVPREAKEAPQIVSVPQPATDQAPANIQPDAVQSRHPTEVVISATSPSGGATVSIIPSPPLPSPSFQDVPGKSAVTEDLANPVQRSPFVSTPEPERIAPSPPPLERRVTAKPTLMVPSPATRAAKTTKAPPVEPAAASLEDAPIAETTSPPTSASVSFLQWSPEPENRIAFLKIGDGPTTLAHEGDRVNGVTVVRIRQDAVDLQSGGNRWTLRTQ